jgi:CRP-like cAMP-binding protein
MVIPKISQDTLADMVGTTRSRVSLFLNKFRKLGFIFTTTAEWKCTVPFSISSSTTSMLSMRHR